jgi:putative DNA primase/helicase
MTYEILSFKNRYAVVGVLQKVSLENLFNTFKTKVKRTKETMEEYISGDREFKLKAKDQGGFIAGETLNNKRDNQSIISRNMITLDLDYCPPNIIDIIKSKDLDFTFFIYSTHSHTPEKPRLRLIVPLSQKVTPEKYEPIGRIIANKIGLEYFDATTFSPSRIMYFPSVSIDGDYICEDFNTIVTQKPLDPNVALDRYLNFLNIAEWQRPHYINGLKTERIEKGLISSSKKTPYRIVNAFNTEYTITQAIDTFLTDVYKKEKKDRYTYIQGESKSGLVILNEEYAFSHHGTDPAQGKLLNAFDIVKIHKFGKMDTDYSEQYDNENYKKSNSFSEMVEFIRKNLANVMKYMPEMQTMTRNLEEWVEGKPKVEKDSVEEDNWRLTLDYTGSDNNKKPESNARNIKIIFQNDEYLKDLFYYDSLRDAICFDRSPGWNPTKTKGELVTDDDDSEIRNYLDTIYRIKGKDLIYDSVIHEAGKKRRHPIRTFLANLPDWDGKPRIETIICELFDIKPNTFHKEASKSWWCGMIQRIMRPGSKYDMMLVISGEQGIGKSQFGKSIATLKWNGGMETIDSQPNFFSDDELPFDKKDAYEQLNGTMIYEMPEFEKYYKKSDTSTIKSFLSKTTDKFRKSYGRRVAEYRRQCVFIATTNDDRPLRDRTGNRRFLPFYSNSSRRQSKLYDPLIWNEDIRNQCLAEALYYYNGGFNPMSAFSPEAQKIWDEINEKATIENESLPIIEMYLKNKFPKNFFNYQITDMKRYYLETVLEDYYGNTIIREHRTEFSLKEIYCIAFNKDIANSPDYILREQILDALEKLGFEKQPYRRSQGCFGQQPVFKMKDEEGEKEEEEEKIDDLPF